MLHFLSKTLVAVLFATILLPAAQAQQKAAYDSDLYQLHQNIWTEILSGNVDKAAVQKFCAQLSDKGAWSDVDYASKQRGNWHPATHLSRLLSMARAYQQPDSPYYHDPALLAKFNLALNYWLANDFQCPNWWYPEIGVPMTLAPALILMENELSKEQMASAIKILDRSKIRMTGQNKVWLSGNVLMKSLLLRDTETIRKAAASIQEELKVSLEEGIQPDGSFHQHGPQIQFGNYGLSYVGDMIKWIGLLRKTPFSFDKSKMAILRNYLLNGQQWIVWKNQMDISACGRQLFVDAQMSKARSMANFFRQMESLDPTFSGQYKKANQFENLTGNRHFWNSDFQVQRTPDYYFSVKMCSERVIGAESCNSENIRGYYLGDGATYLYQSGKEYENIFPYWDWKKIPGTTTLQDDKELPVLTASGYRIKSNFVGGVSDGENGIAVLDYSRNGVAARKAWFNLGKQIVCLGAGIASTEPVPLATTVNQCYLNGEVLVKEQTEKVVPTGSSLILHPRWILHNHTGYLFPDGGNLKLETGNVSGSWNLVALMYKNETIHSPIFKLWFDHGVRPDKQQYAYVLVPGATKALLKQLEEHPAFVILSNTPDLQAVRSSDSSAGGMVFYKAGQSDFLGGIEVDQPCVVMVKKEKNRLQVSVADPTQQLDQVRLVLKGNYQTGDPAASLVQAQDHTTLTIRLPREAEAGKTVRIALAKK